jgi:hypothetical protein
MKLNILWIVLCSAIISCGECTFISYDCKQYDLGSTVQIDDAFYSFKTEQSKQTEVFEEDSAISIMYEISHYERPGYVESKLKDRTVFYIILKKTKDGQFETDTAKSVIGFYEGSDLETFRFINSEILEAVYEPCGCCQELNTGTKTPGKFGSRIKGQIKSDSEIRTIDFIIDTETRKIENRAC